MKATSRPYAHHKHTLPKSRSNQPSKLTDSETLEALDKDYHDLQKAYDDVRRDLQSSSRENRDQSLELRDLKRRLSKLQEQNAQLREQNNLLREAYQAHQARGEKLSKSERSKYNEHFEMLENHISNLQHERHKRETHMESLTEQTREANDGKDRLESEVRKLHRQIRDLSANLTECKDDLLRLQPTSQVSDNEISEQFSNLDQQIAGWVDDKTEDSSILEEKIEGIKTVDDLPELLRMFANPDHLRLAKKYPDSQPLLLRYFIHCYVQTFILSGDVYLFGLDTRNISLLQGMEEGMKQLEPRRGTFPIHIVLPGHTLTRQQTKRRCETGARKPSTVSSKCPTLSKSKTATRPYHPKHSPPPSQPSSPHPPTIPKASTKCTRKSSSQASNSPTNSASPQPTTASFSTPSRATPAKAA